MTVKHSRYLQNELSGGRSLREIYGDCVLTMYSGAAPTNPEDAATGTRLCKITLSSGAVVVTDRGTARVYKLVPGAGHVAGNTIKVTVTVEGAATTYTYTILAADDTDQKVANKVAQMLNDIPQIQAICEGDTTNIWAQCRIPGLALTLADGTGTYAITVTAKVSAARTNALQFSAPTIGVISKPTADTWTGLNLAAGTAGYFRLSIPSDPESVGTPTSDTGYAYPRTQGTLATVGGDATIDPATVTKDATSTVTAFTLTIPASST